MNKEEPLEIKRVGKKPGVCLIEKAEHVDPAFLHQMDIKQKNKKSTKTLEQNESQN